MQLTTSSDLEDIFRKREPSKLCYSFSRAHSKSRIDFFLMSNSLDSSIHNASIEYFPYSDHDIVRLNSCFRQIQRGPGVWKMNIATIKSALFKESIERL